MYSLPLCDIRSYFTSKRRCFGYRQPTFISPLSLGFALRTIEEGVFCRKMIKNSRFYYAILESSPVYMSVVYERLICLFIAPLLPFVWAVVIFICTCNLDPVSIWTHPFLFQFNVTPKWSDLLITSDIDPTDHFYLFQKVGHFTAFGLLYALLFNWIRKYKTAFILCGSYAILTEILQLFFYRDGRLFDVLIDLTGISLSLLICKSFFKQSSKIK